MQVEFGKYLLQRKLAEGGMAEVFLARQRGEEGFEKPVVIKRILPHLTTESQFVDMFLNEAKVAARLSHSSIVQIFDFGKIDGQYYIAMEFIHGEDLRNVAKQADKVKKRPSFAITSRIIADMLGGLHYAHTRIGSDGRPLGLVHRDISPQNVLVTYEGGVKLVDFGIAKATESATSQQTQAGMLKGKYAYMSPEQTRGKGLDARSDVFAVGILLWEFVTWKRLFRRENDLATLVAVADEAIPTLSSIRRDIPPELERIAMKALARAREERYPSAQAMRQDLEGLIRKQGWEADAIVLQDYVRDLFADKLKLQDKAIREMGVGSIEDFLVRVEEGTKMAWIDPSGPAGPSGTIPPREVTPAPGSGPAALPPPPNHALANRATEMMSAASPPPGYGPGQPTLRPFASAPVEPGPAAPSPGPVSMPTQMMEAASMQTLMPPPRTSSSARTEQRAVVVAPVPRRPAGWGGENTPSTTLGRAVGQQVPRRQGDTSAEVALPPARWKRALVIAGTGAVVAGGALAVLLWPQEGTGGSISGGGGVGGSVGVAGTQPTAPMAKLLISVDVTATANVDGVGATPCLPGQATEIPIRAGAPHDVKVFTADGKVKHFNVPSLEPGAIQPMNVHLGVVPAAK